jgi:hypothetical protein
MTESDVTKFVEARFVGSYANGFIAMYISHFWPSDSAAAANLATGESYSTSFRAVFVTPPAACYDLLVAESHCTADPHVEQPVCSQRIYVVQRFDSPFSGCFCFAFL